MKTTKRVLAIALAVLMLALAIPFSASAAQTENNTLDLYAGKPDVTFNVYLLANLDTETGKYNFTGLDVATEVQNAIKTGNANTIATAADTEFAKASPKLGTTIASNVDEYNTTAAKSGLYYVHYYGELPDGITELNSLVIPAPYYAKIGTEATPSWHQNGRIDVTGKAATGAKIDKIITNSTCTETGGDKYTDRTLVAFNEDVDFQLEATIPGTTSKHLVKYIINDDLSDGLTLKPATIKVYLKGDNETLLAAEKYNITKAEDHQFTIDFVGTADSPLVATEDSFYSNKSVIVRYSATLNENAVVGNPGNPNDSDLLYKVDGDAADTPKESPTVYAFTIKLNALKVDANDHSKKLGGATFKLSGNGLTTPIELTTPSADKAATETAPAEVKGQVTFNGLKAGTYKLQETKAPEGYNLNTKVYDVVIGEPGWTSDSTHEILISYDGNDYIETEIENTPAVLPKTGDIGNTIFYVIGGSLILCAGVLFLIVMRKKSAK